MPSDAEIVTVYLAERITTEVFRIHGYRCACCGYYLTYEDSRKGIE